MLQVLVHEGVVGLGRRLDHLLAVLLGLGPEVRRDLAVLELHPLGFHVPVDGLHADQVDHALEAILGADRQLDRQGVGAQARPDLVEAAEVVGAGAVHLVDERDARHAVLVHLPPHGLGLRLHAGHGAEQRHGGVEHAQGALHLDGEVDVPRSVEDVDAVLGEAAVHPLPETGGRRGGNGDAALLLLLHVVHHGRAVVDLADLVRDAGVKQDALGRGRLPRVDVRGDADVPITLDGRRACHSQMSF